MAPFATLDVTVRDVGPVTVTLTLVSVMFGRVPSVARTFGVSRLPSSTRSLIDSGSPVSERSTSLIDPVRGPVGLSHDSPARKRATSERSERVFLVIRLPQRRGLGSTTGNLPDNIAPDDGV